jgi:hypothetical protein
MAQRGEYNEYLEAARNEQRQRLIYERNPSRSNYNEWQDAVRDAQEEWAKYQRALREEGNFRSRDRYVDPYGRRVVVNPDPYGRVIYTTPTRRGMFRIYTDGVPYTIDDRGYSLLRGAVNSGYQQGYMAGRRDRRFGRFDPHRDSMFVSGMVGYDPYVAENQYQYYFQQGFQRGYEDGFYARTTYGYRTGSTYNILGSVMNTILNIAEVIDD